MFSGPWTERVEPEKRRETEQVNEMVGDRWLHEWTEIKDILFKKEENIKMHHFEIESEYLNISPYSSLQR